MVLKIATWNVNGLRSMKRDIPSILNDLDADILCLQETKISRSLLQERTAIVDGYSSFFNFPKWQSGYSGVATYCNNACTPCRAADSLITNFTELQEEFPDYDLVSLDSEGRVMITYHDIIFCQEKRLLAIINVYCPRVDPDKPERHIYKMHFLSLLEQKAQELQNEGSLVMILGDLNISHKTIDHCDPGIKEEFEASESRQWLTALLKESKEPSLVDSFRHLFPDQKEAYTCWNTLTGARQTNYGTRIDYILISKPFSEVLSSCKILSNIHGSDHCPVTASLNIEMVPSLHLPPLCTKLWPEFAGTQQKLSNFVKKSEKTIPIKHNSPLKLNPSNKKSKTNQHPITSFFKANQASVKVDTVQQPYDEPSLNSIFSESNSEENNKSKMQWKAVLRGPPKPPLCSGHKKLCVLRTVRKDGPNLGRQFFSCPQPNGLPTNPEASCNFFKWVTPAKKTSSK